MAKRIIDDEQIKDIAEKIILSHVEDIEWLTIAEMSNDLLYDTEEQDSIEEQVKIWGRVDAMLKKARVTISFQED